MSKIYFMEMSTENQADNWRFEKKYPVALSNMQNFFKVLHDSAFYPAYPSRIINNCYYDNTKWDSFYDNVNGLSKRSKVRFRWYDKDLVNGHMEIKIKHEDVNRKEYPNFNLLSSVNTWKELLGEEQKHCYPTLINQYKREYFQDFMGNRLTIDSHLKFAQPTTLIETKPNFINYNEVNIIEIKYNTNTNLSDFKIPTPLLKFSKYVTGIKHVY